ncbi:MAG: sensor histidine kinase [Planctomycetota bacterium]|jgi:signal transduction histidine kinase
MPEARRRALGRLLMPDHSLLDQIAWFNRLRFLAVIGMAIMTLEAERVFGPSVTPLPFWVLMTATLAVNLVYVAMYRGLPKDAPRKLRRHVILQVGIDLIILTFFLHFSGGVTNPLVLFYLFHTFIASLLLSGRAAVLVAIISLGLIASLGFGEFAGFWTHYPIEVGLLDLANVTVVELCMWMGTLGIALLLSVYFISTLLRQVSAQEEDLIGLSHQLARTEKLASVGNLAAGVSHEINNPIGVIASKVKILRYRIADEDPPEALLLELDSIDKHVGRVSAITEGLLTFSRESEFELRPLSTKELIEEAADLVKVPYERAGIELRQRLNPEASQVMGSFNHLLQVLVNVLLNAKDASKDGAEVAISSEQEKGELVIRIRDQGSGISDEDQQQIFDPFFTTKEVGHGTGLGLAISHRMVERHGGRIEVRSQLGEWTEFSIHLPARS